MTCCGDFQNYSSLITSQHEILNDEAPASVNTEPYFDSQTVQKNVTGLVGKFEIDII